MERLYSSSDKDCDKTQQAGTNTSEVKKTLGTAHTYSSTESDVISKV